MYLGYELLLKEVNDQSKVVALDRIRMFKTEKEGSEYFSYILDNISTLYFRKIEYSTQSAFGKLKKHWCTFKPINLENLSGFVG